MRVLIFVTGDPKDHWKAGAAAIIPDQRGSYLPLPPPGLDWHYFATMPLEDGLLSQERTAIEAGIARSGYFISERVLA